MRISHLYFPITTAQEMSLATLEDGSNLFEPLESGENAMMKMHGVPVSDLAYHFTAGWLRHAGAITALSAPSYNSYQGLVSQGGMPHQAGRRF